MPDLPSMPLEISVAETQRLVAQMGADLHLIDVRDPDEFAHCKLPGAELIPLSTLPSEAAARLPDKTADIVLYCHHGMRSMQAAEHLRQLGYAKARSMAGGIDKWATEIDSTVARY